MEPDQVTSFRQYWSRSGGTIARTSALPLFLMGATGWIPNAQLDFLPKGPWPWGAIVGLSLIVVGVVGVSLAPARPSQPQSCESQQSLSRFQVSSVREVLDLPPQR